MDIYIKKAIIHQFSPDDTELFLADKFLNITPKIEEYLRKKIERVYSDEAKTGIFEEENPFFNHITDDLLETSVKLANLWKEEFSISENLKTNDLILCNFLKKAWNISLSWELHCVRPWVTSVEKLRIQSSWLRITCLDLERVPMKLWWSIFRVASTIWLKNESSTTGLFLNYFSDNLLAVAPKISPKKSIKELEKTAQRIAETFNTDDFQFQSKVKSAIFNNLEESNELSPEKLANDLFDNNLTARLSFIDQVKEAVPEPVQFDEIDASRQLKKIWKPKLSLSNGIELIVPNNVYQDAESVEFIQNDNGTYSILIKNIEDIQSK